MEQKQNPFGPSGQGTTTGISDTSAQDIPLDTGSGKKTWLLAGGALACLVVALFVVGPLVLRWSQAEGSVPRDRLRIAEVVMGDLVRDVSVEGRVVAAVSPTLFAPADGTVTLMVESGAAVSEGEVLALIESPELENRLGQEQSTLDSSRLALERQSITNGQLQLENRKNVDLAEVTLKAARRELTRAQQAFSRGAIPEIDLRKAEDDLDTAQLAFEHAQQDIELDQQLQEFELRTRELEVERQALLVSDLERQVSSLSIRSPVNGIIGNLQVDQKAAMTRNQAVMTVVDLTAFEVESNIPESYADDLGLGMPAEVRVGARVYQAEVVAVSPEIVDNQVTTRLRFVDTPPDLRQNQQLTTRILLENRPGVLMVERGQFLESGAGRVAYVIDGSIARRVPIQIGARSLNGVEILSGLHPGDSIITSSLDSFDQAETLLITD